jgi:hypothetical protein
MDIVSFCPLGLVMLDRTAIAFHSNEDGFAVNIPLVAAARVNFTRFSSMQRMQRRLHKIAAIQEDIRR